jgi:O-methyltransferase
MKNKLQKLFNKFGYKVTKFTNYTNIHEYEYLYNKFCNYTMIPLSTFCENITLFNKYKFIKGDIVECGVWKGGMIAGIAEIVGDVDRTYYLFDSFEGLPDAQIIDGSSAQSWQKNTDSPNYYNNCKSNIEDADEAMNLSSIKNYKIVKGWFKDTLPNNTINEIAILRLDGDWYDSIYECMHCLFPKVVNNGLVIVDDYYVWEGTSKAIHDYLSHIQSSSKVYTLADGVAYIIKSDKV